MLEIKGYAQFAKIEPIIKGWSGEEKFYVETKAGQRLLLRKTLATKFKRKQLEQELMKKAFSLGVPMPEPIQLGLCQGGASVYSLFTWCDGEDAEAILPNLSDEKSYDLGVRAGKMLRLLHSISAPDDIVAWDERFNQKVTRKMEQYKRCNLKFDGDHYILDYLEQNRDLLKNRPQSFQHGDYHVGNMVVAADGALSIIDFNRLDFGDPWEEFNRIVFSAASSASFATGQLHGYFDESPPLQFFQLLAFYIGTNTLSALPWAIPFGQKEIETMQNQAQDVLAWFDNMKNPVPTWYFDPS